MKQCTFEGCERQLHSKGLCHSHYEQYRKGIRLRALRPYKLFVDPAPGKKVCTRCERVLDREKDFYKRASGAAMSWCKQCMRESRRQTRELKRQ